jgi:hypothetical protein
MNYHRIKEFESKTTKNYSDFKLSVYINLHKFLLFFTSNTFFWIFSMGAFLLVPFFINNNLMVYMITLIFHLFSWEMYLKDRAKELISKNRYELELTISVLSDIKSERNN